MLMCVSSTVLCLHYDKDPVYKSCLESGADLSLLSLPKLLEAVKTHINRWQEELGKEM